MDTANQKARLPGRISSCAPANGPAMDVPARFQIDPVSTSAKSSPDTMNVSNYPKTASRW